MRRWKPRWARAGVSLAVGTVAVVVGLVPAAPAAAHVTAHAEEAVPGESARVVFRAPNESDTNATTGLEVHLLPSGAPPIPTVLTTPVPGWSVEVTTETLDEPVAGPHGEEISEVASVITWTADPDGDGIQPGEFGEFPVELGPLPEAEELFFPTFQIYEGLDAPIEWIERPDPDGAEPPNPAPVLRLASPDGTEPGESGEDAPGPAAGTGDVAAEDSGSGSAAVWLALAGLFAGLAGLALAAVALRRTTVASGSSSPAAGA